MLSSSSSSFSLAFTTLLVLVVTLTTCDFPLVSSRDSGVSDGLGIERRFHGWMAAHGRSYATAEEKLRRFEIYQQNVEFIEAANRDGRLTYKLGENAFTDLTHEEFLATHTSRPLTADELEMVITTRAGDVMQMTRRAEELSADEMADLPSSIDWRTRQPGSVTKIKDQKNCAACWAFAAVAAMETAHAIKHEVPATALSEQQLVDCDTFDNGCFSGKPYQAFNWAQQYSGGIVTESSYGYRDMQTECRNVTVSDRVHIKDYAIVAENDEAKLMQAVAKQPVSVLFDGTDECFKNYHSGVYNGHCIEDGEYVGPCTSSNFTHAMAIVGYDEESWIAKNSWGTGWGDDGYVRLKRNVLPGGLCGLAFKPSYPIMA